MSVKGMFSAFICGSSGLPARLLKYLSVCFMLPVLFIAGSAAAAEELEAEASDYYFIASFSEPITINMSAAIDPIRMSALWQNEPATGTILCFLQFPDGSPFVRYRRFKAGSKLNYHINYRCWPSASIGFINHFPDENSEACHIISLASMSENISEIGLHFWCEGFRRSRPVIVKILPDHTASPSRVILRLQHVEPILWSFREPSGQPVPSATVSIYEHGHGFIDDLPADASGVVSLPEIVGEPFEPVWLVFSAPGFERYRKKLQPEQVFHNQEFILRPDITESDLGKYEQHPVWLIASAAEIQENVEVEFTLLDLYSNLPLASKPLKLTSLSAIDSGLRPDSRFSELVTDENGCVRVRGLLNFWNWPETSERQRVNYPVQSLDISDIRGGRNSQNRIETVKIRRGGSVKLKISAGSVGQWLSARLFSQKSELNPEKRVINFYHEATSGDIEFTDLNPGRYWIVVANDQRISENFARWDDVWLPLSERKNLVVWLNERAAVGIAGAEVFSGQTTSVDNIKVEPMAMVSGILPTRSSLITSEKGIEWQTLETDWGISVHSIIKGRLMAVPAGKCRGLMPVFNFPVYIGGICYFQLPAGEYDFYDVLSPTAEPVLLGRYFVAAGEMLQLGEIPER